MLAQRFEDWQVKQARHDVAGRPAVITCVAMRRRIMWFEEEGQIVSLQIAKKKDDEVVFWISFEQSN